MSMDPERLNRNSEITHSKPDLLGRWPLLGKLKANWEPLAWLVGFTAVAMGATWLGITHIGMADPIHQEINKLMGTQMPIPVSIIKPDASIAVIGLSLTALGGALIGLGLSRREKENLNKSK